MKTERGKTKKRKRKMEEEEESESTHPMVIEVVMGDDDTDSTVEPLLTVRPRGSSLPRKPSLRTVLTDEMQSKFFAEFLAKEHADEAFVFFQRVEVFRSGKIPEEKLRSEAQDIYDQFISDEGPSQVFVSPEVAAAIRTSLSELFLSTELFSPALREVLGTLRCDTFGRFCTSALYNVMLATIENREAVVDPVVFQTFLEMCVNERGEAWQRHVMYGELEVFNWKSSLTSHNSLVVKSRLRFKFSAEQIMPIVAAPEAHMKFFDPDCKMAEVIRELGEDFKILFFRTDSEGFSRYSIVGQISRKLDAVKSVVIYRSLDWPFEMLLPHMQGLVATGIVKNDVSISGYLMEATGKNACVVTKLHQIDVTEPITSKMMQKATKSRSDVLWRLRLYIEKTMK